MTQVGENILSIRDRVGQAYGMFTFRKCKKLNVARAWEECVGLAGKESKKVSELRILKGLSCHNEEFVLYPVGKGNKLRIRCFDPCEK